MAAVRELFCRLLPDREYPQASRARHFQEETMMRMGRIAALMLCGVLCAAHVAGASQDKAASTASAGAAKTIVNLNTATVDQIETLPGIGRKTAERIIEYRTKNGAFKRIEDLMNVKGIGEKSFLKLKPQLVVKAAEKPAGD